MSRSIFSKSSPAAWWLASLLLGVSAWVLAYPGNFGFVREAELTGIRQDEGFLLSAPCPPEMKKSRGRVFLPPDEAVVLENGVALPVLASGKKEIALAGWGRFRVGSGDVFFSTGDGGDPEGRSYRVRWPTWSLSEWVPGVIFLAAFVALGVGMALVRSDSRGVFTAIGAGVAAGIAAGMLFAPTQVADGFFLGIALPLAWSLSVALLACGGRLAGLLLIPAAALLPAWISHHHFAVSGASHPWFLAGGLLPLSDANLHFTQAWEILRSGEATTGFNGRFLYPLFLSGLMGLTGEHAHLAQFFSCVIVLACLALLTRMAASLAGVAGTAGMVFLFWLYFRLNGAWLSMTENLGLALGLLATGLFLVGAREKRFGICATGLFLFSTGMAVRPGAMFVLPALALLCMLQFGGGLGNLRRTVGIAAVSGFAMLAGLGTNSLAAKAVHQGPSPAYQNFAFSLHGLLTGTHWSRSHDQGRGDPAKVMEENKRLLRENPARVFAGSLRTLEYLWPRGFFFRFDKDVRFVGIGSVLALAGLLAVVFQRSLAEQRGWVLMAVAGILLSLPFAPPWDAGSRPYAVTMPLIFMLCGLGVAAFFHLCKKAAAACGLAQASPESAATAQANAGALLAAAGLVLLLTAAPLFFAKKPIPQESGRIVRPGGILRMGDKGHSGSLLPKKEFEARLSVLGMNHPDLQKKFREAGGNVALMIDWNGPRFRVVDFSHASRNQPGEEIQSVVFDRSVLLRVRGD